MEQARIGMQPLAIMFFLILAELAIGGLLIVLLADYQGVATRGFLGLGAATYLVTGLAALWARGFIVEVPVGEGTTVLPEWQAVEGWSFLVFVVFAGLYTLFMFGTEPRWRRAFGTVSGAAGGLALVASGLSYQASVLGPLSMVLTVVTGAVVLGSAMSGMILGHWYLVTPKLSAHPLSTMTAILLGALAAQAILIPIWLALLGDAVSGLDAATMLTGIYSIPFWLRVLVGIILPIIVGVMTLQCCRIRSLQSATGLLYVAAALVLAGEIAAKLLLMLAGAPV